VHVVCSDVLLEIPVPMLGRSILLYTELPHYRPEARSTPPARPSNSRAGAGCVSQQSGAADGNYDNWQGESSRPPTGCRGDFAATVIEVFDVVKEGAGGAPIIDITSLFHDQSTHRFRPRVQAPIAWQKSNVRAFVIRNVRAFPRNIAIGLYQTWIPMRRIAQPPKDQDPPAGPGLGFSFKTIFCCCRKADGGSLRDERVGYFSLPFNDYSTAAPCGQQSCHHTLSAGEEGSRRCVSNR